MELEVIQSRIHEIRGRRVMFDFDLAQMYGIETAQLKRAVRRNPERFDGEDFMFELTNDEYNSLKARLRCQFGILEIEDGRGRFPKYPPFAFGELGVAMLSSVLNSHTAIEINRGIMRAFVAMRSYITTTEILTADLAEIRAQLEILRRNDEETMEAVNDLSEDVRKEVDSIYNAIGELSVKLPQLDKPRRRIGYNQNDK